jgi:hypothetical protein
LWIWRRFYNKIHQLYIFGEVFVLLGKIGGIDSAKNVLVIFILKSGLFPALGCQLCREQQKILWTLLVPG